MSPVTPKPLRGAFVAMNHDHIIGIDGELPWHYSADLKRFKRRTMGSIIIMGRLTWESIGSKPLPGRRNIVITRGIFENIEHYSSVDTAIEQCGDQDLWVIGGGQIYAAAMPHLNLLDVTLVPDQIDAPNPVRFPGIDPSQWKIAKQGPLPDEPTLINTIYHRHP